MAARGYDIRDVVGQKKRTFTNKARHAKCAHTCKPSYNVPGLGRWEGTSLENRGKGGGGRSQACDMMRFVQLKVPQKNS